ncbi:MAG: alkaline phosphatase [Bacteroidota bacterium]|nr:alkaline phosphatase [Bacteroidota bacterium]
MIKLRSIYPIIALSFAILSCHTSTKTYTPADAHSHNDYKNSVPFYRAYDAGLGSIEADVFAVNGQLMVAHDDKDITPERSLKAMYIDPLALKLKQDTARKLRLLIEIKRDYTVTLPLVMEELKPLSQYFDYPGHAGRLSIVMTGKVPPGSVMLNYPAWLNFDVDHVGGFTIPQLTKIGLVSVPFSRYSKWDGTGNLDQESIGRLNSIIDSAHAAGKKIRFWDTPDNPVCWKELIELHSDVIGTDKINELADFLNKKAYLN